MVPSRERIHIPPGEVRKIIDSKVPLVRNMLVPRRVVVSSRVVGNEWNIFGLCLVSDEH